MGDNWPFLHTPHSRLDCNQYPVNRTFLLTGDINFDRALPAFFSFMDIKQSFHFKSTNICCALPLCQALPRMNTSDCPFTDETDSLLVWRNISCQNNSGHKLAFGLPAYALQNSTIEQWQQRSPAVTSHQQTLFNVLFPRERMAEHRYTFPTRNLVMAQ